MASCPPLAANTHAALRLLSRLFEQGLAGVVLCPGSRSAPLATAAALLERRGLPLLTAIDERAAAFFALGFSRGKGRPAAVITTSGTAVAELLPAAVEADHGTVPLLLLSADRPARLKGCGANQSVNQEEFLACSCRRVLQGHGDGLAAMAANELEGLAMEAMALALGDGLMQPAGPVHLNLPFDEPLHAAGAALLELAGSFPPLQPAEPPRRRVAVHPSAELRLDPDRPGVVVAGPWRGDPEAWKPFVAALKRWQRRTGWPLLADALSGLRGEPGLEIIAAYDVLLEAGAPAPPPPQVLRLGPLPASRRLQNWLQGVGGVQLLISEGDPRRLDPLGSVQDQSSGGLAAWLEGLPTATATATGDASHRSGEAAAWQEAERQIQTRLTSTLENEMEDGLCEPGLARTLSVLLPPGLPVMLANSSPVRDWESFSDPSAPARPVLSFRGASGIDGTLSIACGLSRALGELVLVSGDLALLHDSNGWLWRRQLGGRLTVVLIDNGGGGIFEQLPIRTEPETALDFERLFAMPQPVDAAELAAAHGVAVRRVETAAELAPALAWALPQPLALLVVPTDRRRDAELRRRLRAPAAHNEPQERPHP